MKIWCRPKYGVDQKLVWTKNWYRPCQKWCRSHIKKWYRPEKMV